MTNEKTPNRKTPAEIAAEMKARSDKIHDNMAAEQKKRQTENLERQINMLDGSITRTQTMLQNMQKMHQTRIDADTKKRDEIKAKLTAIKGK